MFKKLMLFSCFGLFVFAASARADALFVGSQAGLCCFNVSLHSLDATHMQMTVTLTDGAQYFVHSGTLKTVGGVTTSNHPGFAFNLAGDPGISITTATSSAWTPAGIYLTSDATSGPNLGVFNYWINTPGNGASAAISGPLVLDVYNASGITYNDFVKNAAGYYFVADIMNASGSTGLSGISSTFVTPNITTVPEPSSLLLLGTGLVGAAGLMRRRLLPAWVKK